VLQQILLRAFPYNFKLAAESPASYFQRIAERGKR